MARVIGFQPVASTDFSDGNALFSEGIKNMALAFKQAKDTISETGQAVRDRNNAILNSYINGIKAEDWDKPETQVAINNMVKTVADNTANMVDLGKVFDTIDKRQSVLVDRSNAQLENQTNKIIAQSKKDHSDAQNLAQLRAYIEGVPQGSDEQQYAMQAHDKLYDNTNITAHPLVGLYLSQYRADLNNNSFKERTSAEQFNKNIGEAHVRQMTQASDIINNPNSTPEQVAQAQQVYQQSNTGLSKLGLSNDTIAGMSSAVAEEFKKAKEARAKEEQDQANKDREFGVKKALAEATIENNKQEIAIAQQNADTNTLGVVSRGGSSNSSGSSSTPKPTTDFEKKLYDSGYTPDKISNNGINSSAVLNTLSSNIAQYKSNATALRNNVSYEQFLSTEGSSLSKNPEALKNGEGFATKGEDFVAYLRHLNEPDWKKIELHKRFANGNFPVFDTVWGFGDDVGTVVKEQLRTLNANPNQQIDADTMAYGREQINMLTKASGRNEVELLLSMAGYNPKTGTVSNMIPQEVFGYFNTDAVKEYTRILKSGKSTKDKSKK